MTDEGLAFTRRAQEHVVSAAQALDPGAIDALAKALAALRARGGRLFILGVGGGAGHAGHAVNDFRKICGIEAYAPTDNVSELTARINDDGWDTSFVEWLRVSRLGPADGLLVLSVGGGSRERGVSMNIVLAVEEARARGATIVGLVGRADGITAQLADHCLVFPAPPDLLTPVVEGFQAIAWHLVVFHPALRQRPGTWESLTP